MHKSVRTIGFCIIQKPESPFRALSDLSFYPHPENVVFYHQQIPYFLPGTKLFFLSILGAHLFSLVLGQYKVSVPNTTLQSYFYNKEHNNVSKYLMILTKCEKLTLLCMN